MELVALSDNVGFVELFHEFLSFILNCEVRIQTVYQDNTWRYNADKIYGYKNVSSLRGSD